MTRKDMLMVIGILAFFISGVIVPNVVSDVRADSINPGVLGVHSKPYNLTYGEWTARWWQWLASIPQEKNPAADETGENCGQKQSGPVWFLAGTVGGSAERACTIPAGKAILTPIINSMCDYASYTNIKSEAELLACAKADNDRAMNLQASIDGVNIKALEKYRIQSPLSPITFPEDNVFGSPQGPTQMVSDGFWIFLEPLSPGKHSIRFGGETASNPTLDISAFATEVTYDLTVQ